ncbi:MAG: aminopeptidase N [Planctomycetota bacterium]|jgi:aminopeptidase N
MGSSTLISMSLRLLIQNSLLLAVLCTGRVAADTYPRAKELDVLEYTFRVTLTDKSDSIAGLASIDLRWLESGESSFELDLSSVVQASGKGMHVNGVWGRPRAGVHPLNALRIEGGEGGGALRYVHEANRLLIHLAEPSKQGTRLYVTISYSGIPASGLEIGETKYGDRCFFSENWPNLARQWMPTIDHPYDKAKSQMIVVAPAHYQVVSNGLLVEETDMGEGQRLTHWRQSVPIATWLYNVGVARFAVQRLADFDGKPVQTWVYPQNRDAGFYDFAEPTHAVLAFYSEQVGPYSYEKIANIQSYSVGGGMESASSIFYGEDSVTGTRSVRWRNVIIHELAHQWFGNAVTESDWDDVWLSEGFATYFTLLFREHAYGRDDFVAGLKESRDDVLRFYRKHPDYRILHNNLDDMSRVTTGMQYQKGAWTLHMLRRQLGTEVFWQGIRDYYKLYRNKTASTADFRRVMEERSGQSLEWFFDQWLIQGGVPELRGTWSFSSGKLELEFEQTQKTYRFRVPLELELQFADGSFQRQKLLLDTTSAKHSITVAQEPVAVLVDPDTWFLGTVDLSPRNN